MNSKFLTISIAIVGLIAGYLLYTQLIQPTEIPTPAAPVSSSDDLKSFQNLKIDFSTLDNATYQSLTIYGESPVNPGVTGKKDLFQ